MRADEPAGSPFRMRRPIPAFTAALAGKCHDCQKLRKRYAFAAQIYAFAMRNDIVFIFQKRIRIAME
jgi:hypothetical protein